MVGQSFACLGAGTELNADWGLVLCWWGGCWLGGFGSSRRKAKSLQSCPQFNGCIQPVVNHTSAQIPACLQIPYLGYMGSKGFAYNVGVLKLHVGMLPSVSCLLSVCILVVIITFLFVLHVRKMLFMLCVPPPPAVLTCWSWKRWCRKWRALRSQMRWPQSSWRPWQEGSNSKLRCRLYHS